MTLQALLSHWRADPNFAGNVQAWHTLPAQPASYAPIPTNLHPKLSQALAMQDIHALYTHQAAAWEHAQNGKNIVIVTGTASGKTLGYNLPVLDRLLRDEQARALYLFPTKALANDQYQGLQHLLKAVGVNEARSIAPAVYDGDTPASSRPAIRNKARLIISNPDMLHVGILPHHTNWAEFFQSLQFVIIDELHLYRGVFGSHVANVIRRLQRIAHFYNNDKKDHRDTQFILTSATIANPAQLAEILIEAPVEVVDQDGSGHGERHFIIYNPPIIDPDLGIRRSLSQESVHLAEDLHTYDVQTILFARARRTVELILTYLRERIGSDERTGGAVPPKPGTPPPEPQVRGYRSGYLPKQRREIEQGLRLGKVRTVVTTNALEVGIDIGQMSAAILAGYPGAIASTWQQAGRAGRKGGQNIEPSLAVLITSASPLDQFLAHHPDYFFKKSPEQGLVNPNNLMILLGHLRCAAFELPFRKGDCFGSVDSQVLNEFLAYLHQEGVLHVSGERYYWMADAYPSQGISLRSASADVVSLRVMREDGLQTIGQVDLASSYWMVHPGAIYLHEGQSFLVDVLDLEEKTALLQPVNPDFYTEPLRATQVQVMGTIKETPSGKSESIGSEIVAAAMAYGEISVTSQVTGFRKVNWLTHENLGAQPLEMPSTTLLTTGCWITISDEAVKALSEEGLWNNTPNDYGPGWEALRIRVRQRDDFCCQKCSAPEQGKNHDVHHKIPFRTFNNIAEANRLDNLVTLCPSCHHQAETAVRMRSGLSGAAYALANLAPLFLMCDPLDLGIHTDAQSPLADGKPVIVIYDQIPAGIGLSERLHEIYPQVIRQALGLVSDCECSDGCPSCVGPGGEQGIGGKREALALLKCLAA